MIIFFSAWFDYCFLLYMIIIVFLPCMHVFFTSFRAVQESQLLFFLTYYHSGSRVQLRDWPRPKVQADGLDEKEAPVPDRAAVRAAVPEPPAGHVGRRADADDEERPVRPGAHKAGGAAFLDRKILKDKNVTFTSDTAMEMRSIGVLHWIKHAVAHGGHELQHLAVAGVLVDALRAELLRIQSHVVSECVMLV